MNFSAQNERVPFRVEPLGDAHQRASFDCGEETLARYFRTQVTQDVRRHVATCFVAIESRERSNRGILHPVGIRRVRSGRFAVARRFQGRGLGSALLADATARTIQADIAAWMRIASDPVPPIATARQIFIETHAT